MASGSPDSQRKGGFLSGSLGQYERKEKLKLSRPERIRTQTIRDVQDIRRSIDYLETRPEIDHERLASVGFGGAPS